MPHGQRPGESQRAPEQEPDVGQLGNLPAIGVDTVDLSVDIRVELPGVPAHRAHQPSATQRCDLGERPVRVDPAHQVLAPDRGDRVERLIVLGGAHRRRPQPRDPLTRVAKHDHGVDRSGVRVNEPGLQLCPDLRGRLGLRLGGTRETTRPRLSSGRGGDHLGIDADAPRLPGIRIDDCPHARHPAGVRRDASAIRREVSRTGLAAQIRSGMDHCLGVPERQCDRYPGEGRPLPDPLARYRFAPPLAAHPVNSAAETSANHFCHSGPNDTRRTPSARRAARSPAP